MTVSIFIRLQDKIRLQAVGNSCFKASGRVESSQMPDRSVISNDISACSFPGPTLLLLIKNSWVSFVLMYVVVKLV